MTRWRQPGGFGARCALIAFVFAGSWAGAEPARGETRAWVSGDRVLNLRTGAKEDDRAIGVLRTGDEVALLARDGGWAQIRDSRDRTGWVLAAYLQSEPPRALMLEDRLQGLRGELEAARSEAQSLRDQNAALSATDEEREVEMQRRTRENLELRAGERWPFLIAGASILGAGVIVGMIVHWATTKRSQPRIRF